MILDIVRHKFAEALLVLLILALSAMAAALCTPADPAVLAVLATFEDNVAPLQLPLYTFAANHNILAALILLPLFFTAVLRLSRATVRIALYPSATMAAIAIAAVVLFALTSGGESFTLIIIATLACTGFGRLLGCFGPAIRSQRLFSAMLYLGIMPLIESSLLAVVIALPLLLILIRRTFRESVIAIVGAALPLFAYSYIVWCTGGEFTATPIMLWHSMLAPSYCSIATYATLSRMVFVAMLVVMQFLSSLIYISESMSLGPGVRHAWSFMQLVFVTLMLLCILLPSASPALFLVAALSSVAMLPLLYMRVPPYLSALLFVLFFVASYVVAISNIAA